jgi:hypothetical protein
VKDDLLDLSDFVWQRTSTRLIGLTDEEYFWEPVPGCWTIRDRGDGCHHPDGVRPAPEPAPFTTIAWRLAHLTGCYGADRNGTFLRVELEPPVLDRAGVRPATAEAALDLLGQAHSRWRRHLSGVQAEAVSERLGPIAGPYAEGTLASFVLHMLDEFIHHGAELALLRDLYRATAAGVAVSTGDALVDAAIRDPAVFAVLAADAPERDRAIRDHPDAVSSAASVGQWDLAVALVTMGFDLGGPGQRTALHLAAGAGALHAVRALVERGADTTILDPVFGQTPLGWAQYFGSREAADYLAPLTPGA